MGFGDAIIRLGPLAIRSNPFSAHAQPRVDVGVRVDALEGADNQSWVQHGRRALGRGLVESEEEGGSAREVCVASTAEKKEKRKGIPAAVSSSFEARRSC